MRNRRVDRASIGFGANMQAKLDDHDVQGAYFDRAEPADLVSYGLIPEFVGRFPLLVSTRSLDVEQMVLVLTKPKNALVKQYKYLFALSDVDFHITDGALREIATVALSKNTGARGLRAILENILLEAMFLVPERADVTVYIDDAVVRGERSVLFLSHEPERAAAPIAA